MTGSIERRGKNSWRLEIADGTDPNTGERNRYRQNFKGTEKQAMKALVKFEEEVSGGGYIKPQKLTFKQYYEKLWDPHAEKQYSKTTYRNSKQIIEGWILPQLGDILITKMEPVHIIEYLRWLEDPQTRKDKGKDKPLSPHTVKKHHDIVASMLKSAVKWQLIKSNPARQVDPPKLDRKEAKYLTPEQLKTVTQGLENEPLMYRALIMLALVSGMRRSELTGLQWDDIDFKEQVIQVNRSGHRNGKDGFYTAAPKTDKSSRIISLDKSVADLLSLWQTAQKRRRLELGELWQGEGYLFTAWNGKPLGPNSLSGWWNRFLKRNNIDHVPFHGIRHTSTTLLINMGLDVKSISSRLGHSNISITLNVYGHALRKTDQEAADKLGALLTAIKDQPAESEK